MKGEIVSLHLFDVGGTLDLAHLRQRMAGRDPHTAPAAGKGTPAYVEFPRPLVVGPTRVDLRGPLASSAEVTFLFFPIGVVSVRLRARAEVEQLSGLASWAQTLVLLDGQSLPLEAAARALLDRERPAWEASVRDRYSDRLLNESYTLFAMNDVGEPAGAFLDRHVVEVAGLLKGEDGSRLHEKEVKEAVKKWFSYYDDDLIILDWDAAFLVDPSPEYEDLLFVLEIANVQLLEFRAYDDYLDHAVARAYDELGRLFRRPGLFRNARRTMHELSLLRIEVAELADEADNITKFLGDWFLARVYQAAQEKFHLADWRASVEEKLGTINKLYQLANEESDGRRMLTLEALIVLLFVVDLAALFWLGRG